jgi:hypothetical protein
VTIIARYLNNLKILKQEKRMGKKGKEKKTASKKYKKSSSYLRKGAKKTQNSK